VKEVFSDHLRLNRINVERLDAVNEIIEEYASQGYRLTLRQLYYQLVSTNLIPNEEKEYKKLSSLLVKGRMGGVVDWDAIEDRLRQPYLPYHVAGIDDAIQDTIQQYRLDRMKDQRVYLELWVEKDALSGVLRDITSVYHINLVINRGYSSCSAMYEALERFRRAMAFQKEIVILYLGDHDPSGLDMIRDIRDRMAEFGIPFEVQHVALTDSQIKKYKPPPNPTKVSDPRADWYINEFGTTCWEVDWEVDALKPEVLHRIVRKDIEGLIDMDLLGRSIKKEKQDKLKLQRMLDKAK